MHETGYDNSAAVLGTTLADISVKLELQSTLPSVVDYFDSICGTHTTRPLDL